MKESILLSALPSDVFNIFLEASACKEKRPYVYNSSPRKVPSHRAIWLHWKTKTDLPDHKTCTLCGWHSGNYNLERAHMVPRCEGGSDDVTNILLLCHHCHRATEFFFPQHWENLFAARGWK